MEHFDELKQTKIFCSASEFECQAMMFCFKTRFKTYEKGQVIISQGDKIEDMALILKGSANVESEDDYADISILMKMKKGDIFGVEPAYAGEDTYKHSLISNEKTLVMFMNKHRVITPCENKCKRHEIVAKHLMQIVAERNQNLTEKLLHMSKKTIRGKLLSYFESQAKKQNSNYFDLPFNKTELAEYLSVDRSAMSTELSKMKEDGLIDFDKRQFRLIKK